ncbi:MAG: molybdopterin-dependent oxidoreductase, partial [Clostridiales bacterium]|nr:molybdopterin-dependent oxidoreductase [Clostridiales bacterium]
APIGGGFGQKNGMSLEPYVALMAKKLDRPVKWVLSTAEDFGFATTRMPFYINVRLGAKKDGTLMACDRVNICNTGAYATTGVIISGKANKIGTGVYNVPYQQAKTWLVYTNKLPAGAMRGFGMTQPTFAIESIMDMMAEKVGMDPLEFRLKNVLRDGEQTGTGQKVYSVGAEELLLRLRDESGWVKK